MSELKIDIGDLKSEGGDVVKELAEFLEEKTKAEVETTTNEIVLKSKEESVSRVQLRLLLRKFLYKQGLKGYFRVTGGKDSLLVVKEIKKAEEEDED
jgi:hypothetical protein